MPMFGSRQPTRVTIDPSCNGLPAAWDPHVQAMALKQLGIPVIAIDTKGRMTCAY